MSREWWSPSVGRAGLGVLVFALAACEDDLVIDVRPALAIDPAHLDFGTRELGDDLVLPIRIVNREGARSALTDVTVADDCGCFLAIAPPAEVPGRAEVELRVRFRPLTVGARTGTISFATEDPEHPRFDVTLIGRGVDTRAPAIDLRPPAIDFGLVPAGGIAVGSFVIRSIGTSDLLVDRIAIDPPGAPFRITTSTPSVERPGRLPPLTQASVSLRAELPETATATVAARVLLETNVPGELNVPGRPGVVAVPLVARGNLPPVAVVGEAQVVEPWSRATLDGRASHDQGTPDLPLRYQWTLVSVPPGSTTRLERANTAEPSFWVDLVGRYEARLVVFDALGLESQNTALAVVEARPTNAVRIELTWDHPDADLDLHLLREGGSFCSCATDVHYRDCGRRPDWFPETPGANPRLDVDDRAGFGPENINLDGHGEARFIPDGRYKLAVHYYATNAGVSSWPTTTTTATLRVYVYGLLAGELRRELSADGDLWYAGDLAWPAQKLEADGRFVPSQLCASF